ncbi:MAG: hypothetical protein GY822_25735 [Deltaproteobacteria bacterium]|nr:hypothetical protein [Deltaproteobacteria bacterium]
MAEDRLFRLMTLPNDKPSFVVGVHTVKGGALLRSQPLQVVAMEVPPLLAHVKNKVKEHALRFENDIVKVLKAHRVCGVSPKWRRKAAPFLHVPTSRLLIASPQFSSRIRLETTLKETNHLLAFHK